MNTFCYIYIHQYIAQLQQLKLARTKTCFNVQLTIQAIFKCLSCVNKLLLVVVDYE